MKEEIESCIQLITDKQAPPLYRSVEINGVVLKKYSFIDGKLDSIDPKMKASDRKWMLASYKKEAQQQIELNAELCDRMFKNMKFKVKLWLKNRLAGVDPDEEEQLMLADFCEAVSVALYQVMLGKSFDTVQSNVKEISRLRSEIRLAGAELHLGDLEDVISDELETVDRVAQRSAFIYERYISAAASIYNIDIDSFMNEENTLSRREKVNEIERIYENNDDMSYNDVLDYIEAEGGSRYFKNDKSFFDARYKENNT